jgi:hypothetical protein
MCEEQCREDNSWIIEVVGTAFNKQDGQFRVCFSEPTSYGTTSSTSYEMKGSA